MVVGVTISPELSVRRSAAAVAFYKAAFGAVELYRVENAEGEVVSQLSVDGAEFWVSEEAPGPDPPAPARVRMLLQVDDPDGAVARAVSAGATVLRPVAEEHGWRLGEIADPYGHHWEIGRPLGQWPPAPGAHHALAGIRRVLIVDWPSRDVPETLARAGLEVIVRGGAGPEDYSVHEVVDGKVVRRPLGEAPATVDLVYAFRPLGELPGIVATAAALGARAVWTQSGRNAAGEPDAEGCWLPDEDLARARRIVEAAGMVHLHEPYIAGLLRPAG